MATNQSMTIFHSGNNFVLQYFPLFNPAEASVTPTTRTDVTPTPQLNDSMSTLRTFALAGVPPRLLPLTLAYVASKKTCISNDTDVGLTLTVWSPTEETFYPSLLEGDLLLSLSGGTSRGGVIWNMSATTSPDSMMTWTMFPQNGVLFPGGRRDQILVL